MRGTALVATSMLMAPMAKADLVHCHMLMDLASASLGQAATGTVSLVPDGCLYRDLRAQGRAGTPGWRIGSLKVSGEGLDGFIDDGAPPRSLRLEAEGLVIQPWNSPGLVQWVTDLQQRRRPVQLRLSYDWDEASSRVTVNELSAVFDEKNHVRLAGTIDGVDLRSRDTALVSAGGMGLTQLSAQISSFGLFESVALMPLALRFLNDFDDPDAGVAVLKEDAVEALERIPEAILDPDSRAALTALVGTLPGPSGVLSLEIGAAPGLGMGRFLGFAVTGVPRDAASFWSAFGGVSVSATWDEGL